MCAGGSGGVGFVNAGPPVRCALPLTCTLSCRKRCDEDRNDLALLDGGCATVGYFCLASASVQV